MWRTTAFNSSLLLLLYSPPALLTYGNKPKELVADEGYH
jgi:hypothetical protein